MTNKSSSIAAKWWADQLRQPAGFDLAALDNPMASLLLDLGRRQGAADLEPASIDLFESSLTAVIDWEVENNERPLCLSVDYHPDAILIRAMETAGCFNEWALPQKTIMLITKAKVQVRRGYRAELQILYEEGARNAE